MNKQLRRGLTLLEIILATVILTVVIVATAAFVRQPSEQVKTEACNLRIQQLELLAKQYESEHGTWPRSNLRDLTDVRYLGQAIPRCPVDNRAFSLNRRTGEIIPHTHP